MHRNPNPILSALSKMNTRGIEAASSIICKLCEDLSIEQLIAVSLIPNDSTGENRYYRHQPSFDSLRISAAAGCPMCNEFLVVILQAIPRPGINLITLAEKRSKRHGGPPVTDIRITIGSHNEGLQSSSVLETFTVLVASMYKAKFTLKTPNSQCSIPI